MSSCEVCNGIFQTLQRRDEQDGDMTRVIIYKKCQGCGAGRIEYHPFMPVLERLGVETHGRSNS
jgi:hypothetical protein|tara:strand:- start:706 stop:897 length:192 start_codon:yes stop_codon:yes gene_type:complete